MYFEAQVFPAVCVPVLANTPLPPEVTYTSRDEREVRHQSALMRFELGESYYDLGLLDDALREWTQAAQEPFVRCRSLIRLALVQYARGDSKAAQEALQLANAWPAPTLSEREALDTIRSIVLDPKGKPRLELVVEDEEAAAGEELFDEASVDAAFDSLFAA